MNLHTEISGQPSEGASLGGVWLSRDAHGSLDKVRQALHEQHCYSVFTNAISEVDLLFIFQEVLSGKALYFVKQGFVHRYVVRLAVRIVSPLPSGTDQPDHIDKDVDSEMTPFDMEIDDDQAEISDAGDHVMMDPSLLEENHGPGDDHEEDHVGIPLEAEVKEGANDDGAKTVGGVEEKGKEENESLQGQGTSSQAEPGLDQGLASEEGMTGVGLPALTVFIPPHQRRCISIYGNNNNNNNTNNNTSSYYYHPLVTNTLSPNNHIIILPSNPPNYVLTLTIIY